MTYDVGYPTFHGLSDGAERVMHYYTYPESKKKCAGGGRGGVWR